MILKIKTVPNSKKEEIVKEGEIYKVKVKSLAIDGKANKAVIEALADFFKVRKNKVKILHGEKSREKVIEVQY